jgi:dolichol kinase
MELETRRQLIHALGGAFAFYTFKVGWATSVATFAFLLAAGFLIALGYKRGIRVPVLSGIVDASERPEVIEETPAKGALSFFLGALLALLLFKSYLAIISATIIILALGDSFSTLVGKKLGRHKIFYNPQKSWEGSIAGLCIALIGAIYFVPLPLAVSGAVAGMLAESLPLKIDDNITIPVFSGIAMLLAY